MSTPQIDINHAYPLDPEKKNAKEDLNHLKKSTYQVSNMSHVEMSSPTF
jgi:hypothetical protein